MQLRNVSKEYSVVTQILIRGTRNFHSFRLEYSQFVRITAQSKKFKISLGRRRSCCLLC